MIYYTTLEWVLENVRILLFLNEKEFRYVNHYTIERFIVSTKRSGKTPRRIKIIYYTRVYSIIWIYQTFIILNIIKTSIRTK